MSKRTTSCLLLIVLFVTSVLVSPLAALADMAAPPPTPTGLTATATQTSVTVNWSYDLVVANEFHLQRSVNSGPWEDIAGTVYNATSYVDSVLQPATAYGYRVTAVSQNGSSAPAEVSCTTSPDLRAPILSISATTENSISLSWNNTSIGAQGFEIYRSIGNQGNFSPLGTVLVNITSFADTGLTAGTEYFYQVRSYYGSSAYSLFSDVKSAIPQAAPTAPTDLQKGNVTFASVQLTWTDSSNNENGFIIERKGQGSEYASIGNTGANINTFIDSTVSSSSTYIYRVKAVNNTGSSPYSGELSVTTPTAPKPSAPVLSASDTNGSATVSWTCATSGVGFVLERKLSGNAYTNIGGTLSSSPYVDSLVTANNTYYYKIRAVKDSVYSDYSNEVSINMSTPIAPSSLSAVQVGGTVKLSWIDNSPNETSFVIERRQSNGTYSQLTSAAAGVTTYTDNSTLTAGGTYYYRLKAVNSSASSIYSGEAYILIRSSLSSPSYLTVSRSGNDAVLNWTDNSSGESGFYIERRDSSGSWSQIGSVGYNSRTYTNSNVFPSSYTYYYRVRAYYDSTHFSDYSNEIYITYNSSSSIPAPSSFQATVTGLTVNLSWTDNSSNETGFVLERREGGDNYRYLKTINYSTSCTDTLDSYDYGINCYYRIKAINNTSESYYSAETSVSPISPPSSLTASVSGSSVNLTWRDNSSNETGFTLERRLDSGSYTDVKYLSGGYTSYTDSSLTSGTYYYRIKATNSYGSSSYSPEAIVAISVKPSAPYNLRGSALSSSSTTFSWSQDANTTGVKIERRTARNTYTYVTTVNNATSYVDSGLQPATTYWYRIYAYNSAGNSGYSNEAYITTTAQLNPIYVPVEPNASLPAINPGTKTVRLYIGSSKYYVNNQAKYMDTIPIAPSGRVMLPIKYAMEPLGAKITWDTKQKKVTITLKGSTVQLWVGQNKARVNGKLVYIDTSNKKVAPQLVPPGRVLVPLRFVAANLGCKVTWDAKTKSAVIEFKN
ncbi:MAG: fibronectin type III domain-containing protein [Acidobacteriota bacterium]